MSSKVLERNTERVEAYLEVRDRSTLTCDVQTSTWIAAHKEFVPAASEVVKGLVDSFDGVGAIVTVSVFEDPDTGDESLLFEVATRMNGKEARQLVRQFVRESLPGSAKSLKDQMIFSVTSTLSSKK